MILSFLLRRPSAYSLSFNSKTLPVIAFQRNIMRVLNVAEKNDAAKNIASLLSNGAAQKREGLSLYNKIYEFDFNIFNQNCKMVMTSVAGHLLTFEFTSTYRGWNSCDPLALFDAPVIKQCPPDYEKIKKTLEREMRTCSKLIIWTDCDREGENIGFEIIKVCTAVKPNIQVLRARFSEITRQSVNRAVANLVPPDKKVSDAVDVRSELDLRIGKFTYAGKHFSLLVVSCGLDRPGAAFTRFQTLHLKRVFPEALSDNLISYGSCQFPTLGFVVERFKAIADFVPEQFWKIKVTDEREDLKVEFAWKRVRLFNELACIVLYDTCIENPRATVEKIESKPKSKWRPRPLDTVEMEKLVSRKLRINAKETMKVAEKLYTQGYISYPRTETNIFPKDINLQSLVQHQVQDPNWGEFAQRVLQDGPNPFQGNKSDQAHPPIHPTKYADQLTGQEKRIYEFIVRHFLACLSKHAEGLETTVDIDIAAEKFTAKGLMIIAKNYLDVYPYDKWSDKEIHQYRQGDTFLPTIEMVNGETEPPDLLTEADLIALMEKHGIGTDATHAEHIETIKARLYVGLKDNKYFVPKTLGMSLVEGYDNMGFEMSKPKLRSDLESDLKRICDGHKRPEDVLADQVRKYRETFVQAQRQVQRLDEAIQRYLQVQPTTNPAILAPQPIQRVAPCSKCGMNLVLRPRREDGGKFISCEGYPGCREAIWLPAFVLDANVTTDSCPTCGPATKLLKFKFSPGSCYLPSNYESCIGCDVNLISILSGPRDIRASNPSNRNTPNDSGYNSNASRSRNSGGSTGLTSGNNIHCHCGKPAILLTVRKQGPSLGRKFYKCDVAPGEQGCGFFEWADDNSGNGGGGSGPPPPSPPRPPDVTGTTDINCNCGNRAKSLTVQKDGPNKGRVFLCCSQPMGNPDRCNFFQWSDGVGANQTSRNSGGPSASSATAWGNNDHRGRGSRGRGASTAMKRPATQNQGSAKRRKCGLCGAEGHNKRNCSQRDR